MQFTPYAMITFTATLITAWLAYVIWARRPGVGVIPFVVLALGITLWSFGSGFELLLTNASTIAVVTFFTYIGITIVPAAWFIFALQYTGNEVWITRKRLLSLAIEPVFVLLLIATNNLHQLFWESRQLTMMDGYIAMESFYGPAFWIHAIYSYILLLLGSTLLVRAFIRFPQHYRGQITYLLIGCASPWITNFIFLSGLSPFPANVDLTPLAFVITAIATGWSLYRFRLMDIVPVGRETIIDNMDDAIFILDSKSRIVDINRSALRTFRREADDMIGQSITDILAGRQQHLVDTWGGIDEANTDITIELDGTTRAYNLRITPLRNRQDELSGRIVSLHDISALKETNRQLRIATEHAEEATRLKSQFLATMSHELRTPLNAIIGYTELQLLGMAGELNDKQYDYQERVLANSKHLLGLINDILDLSKIEAGRMEMVKKPFAVRAWLDEIVETNAVLAQEKGIAFKHEIAADMPNLLLGDAVRLRQIVINLISNGIKFTKQGMISVVVHPEGEDSWVIMVCDTGIGIPPHKLETIFTEFHQLDNSATREYGGTGLGLAIVRKLVTAMAGTIRVSSTLGEGSTFTVTLPLVEQQLPNSVT
jgi:PAS domain S-box-containing protein